MHYTLSDLISDIVQNSIEAESTEIYLKIDESKSTIKVLVKDNGTGMTKETLEKIQSPFFTDAKKHPARKTGLGLPFFIQTIEQTGGRFKISSKTGIGTRVYGVFKPGNIDTPPTGNLTGLFRQLLSYTGNFNMTIRRIKNTDSKKLNYKLSKKKIVKVLGDIDSAKSLNLLGDFLELQEGEPIYSTF